MNNDERRALEEELAYIERSICWTFSRAAAEGEPGPFDVVAEPAARAKEIRKLLRKN